ncbi:MAG: hypothetical protein IIB14_07210 [Chloroflexi bacterium]|nr:hypothetical protein [Chloroflexota bacterium]
MATEDSRNTPGTPGSSDGLLERLSGRLPAISVAVVALVVVGVLASLFLIPGGLRQSPSEADFPAPPPEHASPTPFATPTLEPSVPDLPREAARLIVDPSASFRYVSPDGGVTIAIEAGSVEEAVSLTFTGLADFQLPALPDGFSGTQTAFDLSAYSPIGLSLLEYSFLKPITIEVELPPSLIEAARISPVSVALQHYEPDRGWTALPAEYNKHSETLMASVSSLSVFALLVQGSMDAGQGPIQGFEPTSTSTSEPTPLPTAVATSSPTPLPTPTTVPTPTRTPEPTPTAMPSPVPTATASATPSPTVTPVPIPAPVLVEPADGTKLRDTTPTFVWSPVDGTSTMFYELQIDDRANFGTTIVLINIGIETSYMVTSKQRLDVDIYYWRVRAIDGGRLGTFSEIRTLDVRRR